MPVADLRRLMREHALTRRQVADLLGVSLATVDAWLASERAKKRRAMPERHVDHLRLALRK